jgi:D-glycero-D-manno-heptose 1,7-bisphosphate phosphatase
MGSGTVMRRAVFLDRDGVINRLFFNCQTGEYESPLVAADLEIYPWVLESLYNIKEMGFLLFLVSNQPSFAKGKTSLENLKEIHARLHELLTENGIYFTEYYYCFHHPNGIVPEMTCICQCRKPSPFFLKKAEAEYRLNLHESWFIGDQDSDIYCGQSCGLKTILIEEGCSENKRGESVPSFRSQDLKEAANIISKSAIENKEANNKWQLPRI